MSYRRAFPVVSIGFCVIYAACLWFKWALFIYYPATHELHRHVDRSLGPPMFFYGFLAPAILGSIIFGGIYLLFPERGNKLISTLLWIAPIATILVAIFMNRSWFA